MATHDVVIAMPPKEILHKDVIIEVSANGDRLGKLTVSEGGIGWFPANAPLERHLSWEQFDQVVKKHFHGE